MPITVCLIKFEEISYVTTERI